MQNIYVFGSLILFSHYLLASTGQEGGSCNLLSNKNGTCVNLDKCPSAVDSIKKRIFPQSCGFNGKFSLVCCEDPITVRLSEIKCNEYYAFEVQVTEVTEGKPALLKEFPHMAAIGFGEKSNIKWRCGGSLISKNFVLTAAHCLNTRELGPAKWVRLGELDISLNHTKPQDFSIKRSIRHPDYKLPLRYHDIALVELDRDVILSDDISIACLDSIGHHDEPMIVTGWGRTEYTGEYSNFLVKAKLDIVNNNECRSHYSSDSITSLPEGIIEDYQICARGRKQQDTCQGDSGGPLQIRYREAGGGVNAYYIVGITSFGKPCGLTPSPAVYTRVYHYLSWIESIVWPS